MIATLRELCRYEAWADAQVLASIGKYQPAWSDTEIHERLHHAHAVQRVFLHLLRGEPPGLEELTVPFESLAALRASVSKYGEEIGAFVESLDGEGLERIMHVPWFPKTQITVRQVLLQVILHSQHHRGQNASRLKQLGQTPPLFDYIVWIAGENPEEDS